LSEILLTIEDVDLVELYGENNVKLQLVKRAFPEAIITSRGNSIKITGDKKQAQDAKNKLETMARLVKEFKQLTVQMVEDLLAGGNPFQSRLTNGESTAIVHGKDGHPIRAKTHNQKKLVQTSEENDVVFAIGPAGTGKTYVSVALAVRALKNKLVKKIILTRPAVEAGENLGFLPGDLKEKVDPFLRPLYDALEDMFPMEKLNFFMEQRTIEVAPLAYMRGRTLDNAFIILDEAQNATTTQIKMFLTRLGPNAKCIITGDLTQIDLPQRNMSGLRTALNILDNIDGIGMVYLNVEDVVRHRLVKEIIKAYDIHDEEWQARRDARKAEHMAVNSEQSSVNHKQPSASNEQPPVSSENPA
jgi:phosphate starvation-inducible protein PhoH and related proteins